jgi:hypothetical protein
MLAIVIVIGICILFSLKNVPEPQQTLQAVKQVKSSFALLKEQFLTKFI